MASPDDRKAGIAYVHADACDMSMFADQSFDIAFSNSVIEHVTEWERQQMMAAEIRRVAKSYWVQTPNRHFPIEPHMLFPFFQYLPLSWRRVIGRYWPFSFEKLRRGDPVRDAVGVRLMTRAELQACFPEATIQAERFLGLAKSWIVIFLHATNKRRTYSLTLKACRNSAGFFVSIVRRVGLSDKPENRRRLT